MYKDIVNSMNINQPFKDKIIEKLDLCFKHKDELKFSEVWLFGSCAKGEPRVGSDIDLLLLTDEIPTREQKKRFFRTQCPLIALFEKQK